MVFKEKPAMNIALTHLYLEVTTIVTFEPRQLRAIHVGLWVFFLEGTHEPSGRLVLHLQGLERPRGRSGACRAPPDLLAPSSRLKNVSYLTTSGTKRAPPEDGSTENK